MAEAMKGAPASKFAEPDLGKFGKPGAVKFSKESGAGAGSKATTTTAKRKPRSRTASTSTTQLGIFSPTTVDFDDKSTRSDRPAAPTTTIGE